MKYRQSGFAHAFLIIGLIVAIVVALGFIFWQNFIYKEPVTNKTETQVIKKPEETKKVDSNAGYVVVDDWGIRFKSVSELSSTNVTYVARSDDNSGTYYAFSTDRIKALGGRCTEQPFGDTVTLTRGSEKPIATPDGELINTEPLNGYFYVLSGPIASCTNFDSNGAMVPPSKVETDDRMALKESIKTLELVQE